jgi:hypothetical protein
MVKDLGLDILNIVPDSVNYDPWDDEDGPSFPALNNELAFTEATGDYLFNSDVLLLVRDLHKLAWVLHWKYDHEGQPVDNAHGQSALDSHIYKVWFPDGQTNKLAANAIAEVLYAQCKPNGNGHVFVDTIMDYQKDHNVAMSQTDSP